MQFHGASYSLHVGTDILIFTRFSKTLSLFSSGGTSDKASHAHKEYASRWNLNRGLSFVFYKFSINSEAVTQLLKNTPFVCVYNSCMFQLRQAYVNTWNSHFADDFFSLHSILLQLYSIKPI
jgi:hypothetical protein